MRWADRSWERFPLSDYGQEYIYWVRAVGGSTVLYRAWHGGMLKIECPPP